MIKLLGKKMVTISRVSNLRNMALGQRFEFCNKVIAIEADKDNKKEPISCIKPYGQG